MFLRQAASRFLRRRFLSQFSELSSPNNCQKKSFDVCLVPTWKDRKWSFDHNHGVWLFLSANAAIYIAINANPVLAKEISSEKNIGNDAEESNISGLQKVEDGSAVSDSHTSNWRVFTEQAIDLYLQGKLKDAEALSISALQEAKEGFGARDPRVAFSSNFLAKLYTENREFDKAVPLYLDALKIMEEAYGHDELGIAAVLQNLGLSYLLQKRFEKARKSYERALKIVGRVLGLNHSDYADTAYHLGMVLHLQGRETDAEALILDSIRILEEGGQMDSITFIKRLVHLGLMYKKANRHEDAINIHEKILKTVELTKGRNSLLPEDHILIAENTLQLARLTLLKAKKLQKIDTSKALAEINKAKSLCNDTVRIGHKFLNQLMIETGNMQSDVASRAAKTSCYRALFLLLASYGYLGLLEIKKRELEESTDEESSALEIENALLGCVSAYKKFGTGTSISDSSKLKVLYIHCLNQLLSCTRTKRTSGFDLQLFVRVRFLKLTKNN